MALLGENGAGKSTLIKALPAFTMPIAAPSGWKARKSAEKHRPCPAAGDRYGLSGSEPAAEYVGGG
jgi:predicted ATPase